MQDTMSITADFKPQTEQHRSAGHAATQLKGPGQFAKLPSYGQAYMDQLIGEFKALKDVCKESKAKEFAASLVSKAESGITLTWGDAFMLDTSIAQMLPDTYLHQRVWCLEVKYKDAVGNTQAYDAFMKSEAKDLVNETAEHLQARVHNLIRELYRLYTVIACREDMRQKLSKQAFYTLLWVVGVIFLLMGAASALAYFTHATPYLNVWCIVFALGAAGGLLSFQRRLQSLPNQGESLSDLVELSDRTTVAYTPIIGGIFAIVLFLIFGSGLASGSLFPDFQSKETISSLKTFLEHLQPNNIPDWGKLLVWSFIAGFAERFVPDTLDRLVAKSEKNAGKTA